MIQVIPKEKQASGAFNGGEIIENKPIGFPQEGGITRPYSNLFYWAYAEAKVDSTIGLHPHQGFEIMSFVVKGHIKHYDTKLKEWRLLEKGDAQIIRAGNGISHSEFIAKDGAMFQIWLDPNLNVTLEKPASYDDYTASQFPITSNQDWQIKTYIGKDSPFQLDTAGIGIQEISFEQSNQEIAIDKSKIYSIYVMTGNPTINGATTTTDSFVIVSESDFLNIVSETPASLFVIESLGELPYQTYQEMMQSRMRR